MHLPHHIIVCPVSFPASSAIISLFDLILHHRLHSNDIFRCMEGIWKGVEVIWGWNTAGTVQVSVLPSPTPFAFSPFLPSLIGAPAPLICSLIITKQITGLSNASRSIGRSLHTPHPPTSPPALDHINPGFQDLVNPLSLIHWMPYERPGVVLRCKKARKCLGKHYLPLPSFRFFSFSAPILAHLRPSTYSLGCIWLVPIVLIIFECSHSGAFSLLYPFPHFTFPVSSLPNRTLTIALYTI